jgi:hypothetical protein
LKRLLDTLRPERVNKWPNSVTDIWWWWTLVFRMAEILWFFTEEQNFENSFFLVQYFDYMRGSDRETEKNYVIMFSRNLQWLWIEKNVIGRGCST